MPSKKHIKSFRKLVSQDHVLADKICKTNNFQELASLSQQFGHQITTSEFQEHAETIVAKRTQELEVTSRYNQTKSVNNGFFSSFLSKRRATIQFWEHEMSRLCYYSPNANYDAFGKFQEKGG